MHPCFLSHQDLKQPHHLLNKSNEELKRLAAVESLMEVSAEQNVSTLFFFGDKLITQRSYDGDDHLTVPHSHFLHC
jgi:hypothetical protein